MDNWRLLYAGWGLRKLGLALVTIFGPLYFYTHGYSLRFLFILLALQCLVDGLARPLAAKAAHVFMPGKILCVCTLSMAVIYGLIAILYNQSWPLAVLFIALGFFDGFSWSIYQYIFAEVKREDRLGSQVGLANNISILAAVSGLVLGGFIAARYSIAWNYVLASLFLAFSAVCMFVIRVGKSTEEGGYGLSIADIRNLKRDWASGIGNLFDQYVIDYVWPISLVVILGKAIDLTGYLLASATGLSVLVVYVVGRLSNTSGRANRTMKTGIVLSMGAHGLRWLSLTSGILAAPITVAGSAVRSVADVPYNVFYYQRLESYGRLRYLTVYECINNLFLSVFWFILAVLISVVSAKMALIVVIILALLVLPTTALIPRKLSIAGRVK